MGRLLFLGIIAVVVYLLIRSFSKRIGNNVPSKAENMLRCTYCGVHLPEGEGVMADGNFFCSEAHRRAHAEKPQ